MRNISPVLLAAILLTGCAPPRWSVRACDGLPNTWKMDDSELSATLNAMSNEKMLDLVACNMSTSHPPVFGFPDRYVTLRSTAMAGLLLKRVESRNEGFISSGFMGLLTEMVEKNPGVLPEKEREAALRKCLEMDPPFTDLHGGVHHYCTAFGER